MDSQDNIKKYFENLQRKRHTILPNSFSVQLKDSIGNIISIENIFCHLNIFIDDKSYYTYSNIATNSNGIAFVTKNQIIQATQLKHYYDPSLPLEVSPVRFEFFVLDKNLLQTQIKGFENLRSTDIEMIRESNREFLKSKGFKDEQIEIELAKIPKYIEKEKVHHDFLKLNENQKLNYSKESSKITGEWKEVGDFYYNLIVK